MNTFSGFRLLPQNHPRFKLSEVGRPLLMKSNKDCAGRKSQFYHLRFVLQYKLSCSKGFNQMGYSHDYLSNLKKHIENFRTRT